MIAAARLGRSPWATAPALGAAVVAAASVGAVPLSVPDMAGMLAAAAGLPVGGGWEPLDETVFFTLRLPRVLLAAGVGASLGAGGAISQGLFRNPLADPGLVGVSGGASLGAAAAITLVGAPVWGVAAAAFAGALAATVAVMALAAADGESSVGKLLLAGVAVQALCGAALGLLLTLADDAGLRSVTFWLMGSLGGATWAQVGWVAIAGLLAFALAGRLARALDVLLLGDAAAADLGLAPHRVRGAAVVLVAAWVGVSVAFCGAIGFVGLVVPHLARGWVGPLHRRLLPASAGLGATALVVADTLARTAAAPVELPVGLLTTLVGAPFFLGLLLRGGR